MFEVFTLAAEVEAGFFVEVFQAGLHGVCAPQVTVLDHLFEGFRRHAPFLMNVERAAGVEPASFCLEGREALPLSYARKNPRCERGVVFNVRLKA